MGASTRQALLPVTNVPCLTKSPCQLSVRTCNSITCCALLPLPTTSLHLIQHVKYRCFDDWLSAAAFLRLEKNCELCGIVRPPTAETQLNVPLSTVAPETSVAKTRPEGTSADYGAACCHDATTSVGGTPAAYGTSSGAARMSSEILSIGHGVESVGKGDRDHRSIAVRHRPFRRNTAFVVGHRNRLEDRALAVCDFLVHIEQVGAGVSAFRCDAGNRTVRFVLRVVLYCVFWFPSVFVRMSCPRVLVTKCDDRVGIAERQCRPYRFMGLLASRVEIGVGCHHTFVCFIHMAGTTTTALRRFSCDFLACGHRLVLWS